MRREDLELLLAQSRLVAEGKALARGERWASPNEIAAEMRSAVIECGISKNDTDLQLVERYARGEVGLSELAEHFSARS